VKKDYPLLDLTGLDHLASGDSPIHRLDPRAKIVATLVFIVTVVSFPPREVAGLIPFFVFPLAVVSAGRLPIAFLAARVAAVLPFAAAVAILNPLFDREIAATFAGFPLSGGWLSFVSVILRSLLTVSAALILVATTGFAGVCGGLERLGAPRLLVGQLHFLYRYSFVLADETSRAARARDLRSFGGRGKGIVPFSSMAGHLLVRSWERGERIHLAMLSRGFRGEFPRDGRSRFGASELLYAAGWSALFILFRFAGSAIASPGFFR
jgi:cobalt/nickel transport system permease protein